MKLFYSPSACSLMTHINLREAGLRFDLERVDLATKRTENGTDYAKVNPKGYVPALELDDGSVLTENVALAEYVADRAPEKNLAPRAGTMERYRLVEWLAFVSTEIHKTFGPLFDKTTPGATKQAAKDKLAKRFAYLEPHLAKSSFLMGDAFTVADAYLFTVLRWTSSMKIDMTSFPAIRRYMERMNERPSVKAALAAEQKAEAHAA